MSSKSNIEWTDATWNPIAGCSVVSPGCKNCYAMRQAGGRFLNDSPKYQGLTEPSKTGPVWTGEVRFWQKALMEPLKWSAPRRIFVNSMSDLFHENVPDHWLRQIWDVMHEAHLKRGHIFQILTKRPERIARALGPNGIGWYAVEGLVPCPELGIWLGTSVEDEARKARIRHLQATPAAIRFLSLEPLIGAVGDLDFNGIHWVIVGGESGPKARMMDPDWARDIRDQCAAAGVKFFMKQMSRKAPIPPDLQVREYPEVRV